ncbi:MAG: HNH endonuclease [Nanoarchaeota archaeon]|nr:HNH endonuclease [Nanoarchaeota archaeon]
MNLEEIKAKINQIREEKEKIIPLTEWLKRQVYKRDGYKCMKCGSKDDVWIHHIDHDQTNNEMTNLISMCNRCNSKMYKVKKMGEKKGRSDKIRKTDNHLQSMTKPSYSKIRIPK